MLRRAFRLLAMAAIALVAIVVIGLLILHTNPIQARILQWSVGELERRFDLDLSADDLHYNLATRRVTMTNVRLAALDHPDDPFFVADTVRVDLPWAIFRGQLRFDEVTIDSGSVTIARDASGESNLPPGRGDPRDPNAPPRRIEIRGLQIRNLDFIYRDLQRDIEISTPRIRTDLAWEGAAARGPLAIEEEVLIRVRDRRVTIAPIAGEMMFNGSDVGLEGVRLDTSDGLFVMTGEIDRALDQPTLNLAFTGTTELEQSSRWASPPIHIGGRANIDARMTGAPSAFVLDATVVAESAEVGLEQGVHIDAQAQLTPNGVEVARSEIRPATGGVVQATVDLSFAANSPWWIKANYRGIAAASAFRLAEVEPLAFGADLTGTALITKAPGEPFRLEVHNTATPRPAPGAAPLEGTVEFLIEGNRWRANQDHRMGSTHVTGSIGGLWNRQAATRSTFDSTLAVETQDLGEAARYAALFDLTTPEIVRNASGPVSAEVTMNGTFTEPRFVGVARSDGVDFPSIGRTALSAEFDASARALRATNIDASIGSTTIRGEVLADLLSRELDGRLEVASPDAADLLSALPENLRLEGPLSATAILDGTVDTPNIVADVSGTELSLAGQPVASINATARVVGEGVDVERFTVRQDEGGELLGSGRYDWGAQTYTVDLNGQNLMWRGTLARMGDAEARVALKFTGAGPVDRPVGEGTIEFTVSGDVAGELIDRGIANVRLNGESALITGHIPTLGAFITATVTPRSPFAYESVIVLNRIELAPVARIAGLEPGHLSGTASLSATAKGELVNIAESDAFINLQDVAAEVADVRVQLVTPSRLSWDGSRLTIDDLEVSVGQGRLRASGQLGDGGIDAARWEATFTGQLGDVLTLGRPLGVPVDLEGAGPVNLVWQSTGGLDRSTARLGLDGASVGWTGLPAVRDLRLDATFDGTTLNVSQFTGRWQDGGIEGTASIPRAVLEARETGGAALPSGQAGFAKLRISGLTESALAPWLSTATLAGISGRVSATLDARIARSSLDGISGTLVVDEADFTLAGVSVKQERASIFELDGGLLTAGDVAFNAGGGPMTLTGTARLTPTEQQALNFELKGSADLQILSAFAPTVATGGKAEVNLGIGGTPGAPVFSGGIDVADAEVAIREPRIVISELRGTIAMDGQRVVFDAFTGTANGGRLVLDGGFLLDGFAPVSGGLTVSVERAALEYPQGLQSEANALVTLRPGPTGWSLLGDVSIERSAYTEPISIAGLIAARGMRAPSAAGNDESWIDQLRLNLWVTTLQDVVVDNNYGRFEAGGALRVIGTVSEPVLAGRITLSEGGEVYLGGNTFYLERGSISFANPFRIVPEFDIELRTLVSGTDITLTIDGPLDRLRTDVRSSNPEVDSREAVAMLFGGLQGEDAVTLLSAELLGATGRAIGLDTLRVERGFSLDEYRADPGLIATETDPATRLTISKRLRPDVELILSQSLRESGGLSAVVSYKPRRNIEIRAASRDNLDRSVALRHEVTFGGSGTSTDATPSSAPEVSTVAITGDIQRPVEELRRLLDLNPGEPFNFHEWQQDVDRLRQEYHERNHYEVRVRGIRRPSDDDKTVALEYSIEPGPVSELVLEGHPLESQLEDEIRAAWRRTIFDRFLLEDIRVRIERHLVRENIIGSTIAASVAVSTAERKQIRVVVIPGVPVSSREVRYDGNTRFDADRLSDVLTQSGLAVDAWLDPVSAAEAIADFYRGEGFLSVSVEAEPPSVVGSTGVLPLTVNEGPQFVIGSLTFPGVRPDRLPEVAGAVGLDYGVPFVTAQIDAARQRLERFYAGEGYNTVQIEIDSAADADNGTVAVSFAVLEGPQQILKEVSAQGATRTDDGIITRALRLRIGEPVDLASWSQARKRLYDTNVFRQVDIEPVPITPTAEESALGIQPVRAVVRVVEYPVWRLRYGAQFNDETAVVPDPDGDTRLQSLGILADLQNQNLFGRALTAGIAGRYERHRQAGSLFTSNSSFFGLPIRSSGFLFTSRQLFPTDELSTLVQTVGVSAEQRWRPLRTAEVLWSYRFEREHSSFEGLPSDFLLPVRVARLTATMYFDRRDDPSDPTGGWFASANWEQAVQKLGSDYSNGKALMQGAIYRGIGRLTLAARAQLGTGYGEEGLIFSDRFLLGGATTVRGYAENALGPRDPALPDFPLGGDALLAFNGEVRFPVRGWVQGVGFVDAGNVFEQRSDLSFRDLAVGYGIGLRLASPFAMLRVDFGIPGRTIRSDRPAHQWKSGRWYFGVGHIF